MYVLYIWVVYMRIRISDEHSSAESENLIWSAQIISLYCYRFSTWKTSFLAWMSSLDKILKWISYSFLAVEMMFCIWQPSLVPFMSAYNLKWPIKIIWFYINAILHIIYRIVEFFSIAPFIVMDALQERLGLLALEAQGPAPQGGSGEARFRLLHLWRASIHNEGFLLFFGIV